MSDRNEYNRVFGVEDYGAIGAGTATTPAIPGSKSLFGTNLPQGTSVLQREGKVVPTPAVQKSAQAIAQDPKAFIAQNAPAEVQDSSLKDRAMGMLAQIFNTEDEADLTVAGVNLSGVESTWDTMLRGFNWFYDRLAQAETALISALPGGIRTLTWDESAEVSPGQAIVASMAQSGGRLKRGEASASDLAIAPLTGIAAVLSMIDPENIAERAEFDILNDEQRRQAFESGGAGQFFTGLTDAAIAVVGDPLIIGGKVLKLQRLKYIDRPLSNVKYQDQILQEIADGKELYKAGRYDEMAPVARFIADTITPRADGTRMPAREIIQRDEILWSSDAEGIADALRTVRNGDYDSAALVMAASTGDPAAFNALAKRSAMAADTLVSAKRNMLEQQMALDPQRYTNAMAKRTDEADQYFKIYEDIRTKYDAGLASKEQLDSAFRAYSDSVDELLAIENGVLMDPLARPGQESLAWMQAIVDEAARDDQFFRRAMDEAIFGSLTQADRGFASNTAIGRAVSKRRAAKARRNYERLSTSGQGVFSQDFFGANRFQRTIRVWNRASDANPAYYVATSGSSRVDQGREAEAILNSLKFLSGEAKSIVDPTSGKTRLVGGVQAKDRIFEEFISGLSVSEDASLAVMRMEDAIKTELREFYDLDTEMVDLLVDKAFNKQKNLIDAITQNKRGFFTDASDMKVLQVAPFLESQLSQGRYLLPWDQFETIVRNIQSGKITDPQAQGIFTKGQWTKEKFISANNIFQDFWRPAVLFRLGYPQRNVAEGLFRSMMFQQSLTPLWWATKAVGYAPRNFRLAQRTTKRIEKAKRELAAAGGNVDRIEFDNLVVRANELADKQTTLFGAAAQMRAAQTRRDAANTVPKPTFRTTPAGWATEDEAFQIQRIEVNGRPINPLEWVRGTDGGYTAAGYVIRKEGRKFTMIDEAAGTTATFKTLKEAKAAAEDARPQVAEQFRINELDPAEGLYVPTSMVFNSADEAQAALSQEIERVWNTPGQYVNRPQSQRLADAGEKARGMRVDQFTDPDTGRVYRTADEIDAALEEIADALGEVQVRIDAFGGRPVPAALKTSKFQKWRETQMKALADEIDGDEQFIENMNELAASLGVEFNDTMRGNRLILRQFADQKRIQLRALERDDAYALEMYGRQGASAKRVASPSKVVLPGGVISHDAFSNPLYGDIAKQNLSSDNTIKATISQRISLAESIIHQKHIEQYVDVKPGEAGYWDGMASMLRQYSQSELGKKILRGDTDEDIAAWLMTDPTGKKIRQQLDEAWAFTNPNDPPRIGGSLESAVGFVENVRQGLVIITAGGNKDVWKLMQAGPPTPEALERILKGSPTLAPVVGYKEQITAFKSIMDSWRTITQKAFRQIGTKPEDAFVRAPFYAKRYQVTRDELLTRLINFYEGAERVPLEQVFMVERLAHRRALKDTKDWLYTIDRRTNLGRYGEIVFPFISATQNSLTAVGRLIRKDPAVPGIMLALWSAPTRVGWEDENGNLIIPLPKELIPDGVEDFFGIKGYKNVLINKGSLNVVFPESGFAFVPRPTPLVQAGASELMKRGLLMSVEAPAIMVNALGEKDADTLWNGWKKYIFGEEAALSTAPFSYDKVLPPIMNRLIQYIQKDSSQQYAYQYGLQARTQDLLWRGGYRDEYPTADEIMKRTDGMFLLRMLGNALAFTPPQYQSPIEPLIDIQRAYDEAYGLEGPMKFSETFGSEMLILADASSTKNVGGVLGNPATIRNIRKYDRLLRDVTPVVGPDLDVLGIIVNEDQTEAAYDPNSYRWLAATNIPGTTRKWREPLSGAESVAESQRQAGWVETMKFENSLDALLQNAGLPNYRVKGAERLNAYRQEFQDNMLSDPNYAGWAVDFQSMGSSKTYSAVQVITRALGDEQFMTDKADSKTWQNAALYIDGRNRLLDLVEASGESLDSEANAGLKQEWDTFRQNLKNSDEGWANIANRFLRGDDDPMRVGATTYEVVGR